MRFNLVVQGVEIPKTHWKKTQNYLSNTKKWISTKQTMKEEKILNWKVESDTSK